MAAEHQDTETFKTVSPSSELNSVYRSANYATCGTSVTPMAAVTSPSLSVVGVSVGDVVVSIRYLRVGNLFKHTSKNRKFVLADHVND